MRALRARVRSLQRTLARELAVVRLRRLSEEFCIESSVVRANGQPAPQPHAFIQRVASAGFRSHPSWRPINTSRGAGSKTSSPIAKTSFAPSSPGPGAIQHPTAGRNENRCPILASGGPAWDPQGDRKEPECACYCRGNPCGCPVARSKGHSFLIRFRGGTNRQGPLVYKSSNVPIIESANNRKTPGLPPHRVDTNWDRQSNSFNRSVHFEPRTGL